MGDQHRTLVLLRHAKSAYPTGVADHARPLAPRGVREAELAGDWLRANLPAIDRVLCSTATRARQTWEHIAVDAPVCYVERLYGATPIAVIDEINEVEDKVRTLLVIGHEPTISGVAVGLADADGSDPTALERLSAKFPTSAIALLTVPCRWKHLDYGVAALVSFHVPR